MCKVKKLSRHTLFKWVICVVTLTVFLTGLTCLSVATTQSKSAEKIPVPRYDKKFKDIKLKVAADEFAAPMFEMYADELYKEAGIEFGPIDLYPCKKEPEVLFPPLLTGTPPWDIVQYCALRTADYIETGQLEPLDSYLAEYEGTDEYLDDIMPIYREFYTKYKGHCYALPLSGDIFLMAYRPSLFANEKYKQEFESQYGYPLSIPNTWTEFRDVAKFFTENVEGVYGTVIDAERPSTYAWWLTIAASRGVEYFNEGMEPQINSPEGVKALEILLEILKYCPPGAPECTSADAISAWQQAKVAMCIWYQDLTEFSAKADVPVRGDQAIAPVPGTLHPDGRIVRRTAHTWGRCLSIIKNQPKERKEAAFYAIYRLSHSDYSSYSISDAYLGVDPFLKSHFVRKEAVEGYVKPNPLRGITADWPTNEPPFTSLEKAKEYLKVYRESTQIAFPQPIIPGASEYTESLSRWIQTAYAGEVTAREALDNAAQEWREIVKRYGKKSQKEAYNSFMNACKALGY